MTTTTPQPGPAATDPALQQRIRTAVHAAHREWMRPGSDAGQHLLADALTNAVLAALAPELARLRKAEQAVNLLAGSHRRAEEAEAALTRVRELHQPVTWPAEPPQGAGPDAEHFDGPVTVCAADSDDPRGRTYWTPWPCATIRALNTPHPTGDSTP
jgi:hypothetical protein